MNLVYIVESETGLRRDGVRVRVYQNQTGYTWGVDVPTIARSSSAYHRIAVGEAPTRSKARSLVRAVLAIYDKHRAKRISLGEASKRACIEINSLPRFSQASHSKKK